MSSEKAATDIDALIDEAEGAGLILVPWPDGTFSIFGDKETDADMVRALLDRRDDVVDAIHRRAEVSLLA